MHTGQRFGPILMRICFFEQKVGATPSHCPEPESKLQESESPKRF